MSQASLWNNYCIFEIYKFFEKRKINVFCRLEGFTSRRKVGAIQGAILPNRKGPQPVDTASATENNRLNMPKGFTGKGENVG